MSNTFRVRNRGSAGKVCLLFLAYGLVHSFFASRAVKSWVEQTAGRRVRNGLYRPFFIVQSVVTTGWAIKRFLDLRDRDLYEVRAPWSWALRGVQVFATGLLLRALAVVGYLRLLGVPNVLAFVQGKAPPAEPEAQGPPPDSAGRPILSGPFGVIRHPDNLFFALLLWALPRMTVNRLTLAVLSTLYAVVGSWHEDSRMRVAYGDAFAKYQHAVPLLFPRIRGHLRQRSSRSP